MNTVTQKLSPSGELLAHMSELQLDTEEVSNNISPLVRERKLKLIRERLKALGEI